MKKHIVFDFDDTLTNSYDFNQQMFVDTFMPYSSDLDEKYLRDLHYQTRGKAMHLLFEEACKKLNLQADPHVMTKENEEMHQKNYKKVTMFEGTEDLLKSLKDKGKLVSICTNRQYGSLERILKHHNLLDYFDNIISCKDEGHEKPDPYCINMLIKKYDMDKEAYVYFGDSKVDYEFAEAAGIDFIIVDHYINKKQLFKILLEAMN